MSRISTKTGDKGMTSLIGGTRVSKSSDRLEAYGTVDELNSYIGLLQATVYRPDSTISASVETVENFTFLQSMLFKIGGSLATDVSKMPIPESCQVQQSDVERVEQMTDQAEAGIPEQRFFILPGGTEAASIAHVARCVCRRAERDILRVHAVEPVPMELLSFMNRLSDYLFVLARRINHLSGLEEKPW